MFIEGYAVKIFDLDSYCRKNPSSMSQTSLNRDESFRWKQKNKLKNVKATRLVLFHIVLADKLDLAWMYITHCTSA